MPEEGRISFVREIKRQLNFPYFASGPHNYVVHLGRLTTILELLPGESCVEFICIERLLLQQDIFSSNSSLFLNFLKVIPENKCIDLMKQKIICQRFS